MYNTIVLVRVCLHAGSSTFFISFDRHVRAGPYLDFARKSSFFDHIPSHAFRINITSATRKVLAVLSRCFVRTDFAGRKRESIYLHIIIICDTVLRVGKNKVAPSSENCLVLCLLTYFELL